MQNEKKKKEKRGKRGGKATFPVYKNGVRMSYLYVNTPPLKKQ